MDNVDIAPNLTCTNGRERTAKDESGSFPKPCSPGSNPGGGADADECPWTARDCRRTSLIHALDDVIDDVSESALAILRRSQRSREKANRERHNGEIA